MLPLARHVLDLLALATAAGAAVALLAGLTAHLRFRRLRRRLGAFRGPHGPADIVAVAEQLTAQVEGLRAELAQARAETERARADLANAVRHVAVVRYDAFGDASGRLSFSAALLDEGGDGLVFTAINGRTETRSYAKAVRASTGEQQLSPEEEEAVRLALGRAVRA